jgi:hypothetical protein
VFPLCVSFTAEIASRVVRGQQSVYGSQQLGLDLHDADYRRTFRQHSLPCQNHVGKLVGSFCLVSAFTSAKRQSSIRSVFSSLCLEDVSLIGQVDSSRPYFC